MKSILFVAQDSYPLHGAESIVNLKLLAALSQSGEFTIDLISKKVKGSSYGENSLEELKINIRNLHIIEVDNKINFSSIWEHLICFIRFGIVFKGSHWAALALEKALALCERNKYDYVLTKNQASVLVGYYLKRHLGLKWVATWNDPFPSSLYPKIYKDFFREKDSWAYRKIIQVTKKYVDFVVVPNTRLRDYLLPFYKVEKNKTIIIPHVVNNVEIETESHIPTSKKSLRLLHSGNISYPREPKLLLKAIKLFTEINKDADIRLDILGMADDGLKDQIRINGLEQVVRVIPPVSYVDSLKLLDDYDVAVVVEAVLDEGIFLPTKVSDFMQCKKAIATISPSIGVLNDLYKDGYIGYFADNSNVDSIFKMLQEIWIDFKGDSLKYSKIPNEYTEQSVVNKYLTF